MWFGRGNWKDTFYNTFAKSLNRHVLAKARSLHPIIYLSCQCVKSLHKIIRILKFFNIVSINM